MSENYNNIKSNKNGNNCSSMIVTKENWTGNKNLVSKSGFLTPKIKITFIQLGKAFIKVLILQNLELD